MPFGLLTGLVAALLWGSLDVITALASRVIGSLRVAAGMLFVTAIEFALLVIATGTTLPSDTRSIAIASLQGLVGAGAYMAYFTGLQYGPISVVSGTVAAFGGLTVVLSVVFRGETLTSLQAAGAFVSTAGVIMTGIAFDGGIKGTRFAGPGVIFALVALVMFALMAIISDIALETMSIVQLYSIARGVNTTLVLIVVVVLSRVASTIGRPPADGPSWPKARLVGALILVGTLDVVGLIAFSIGLESAPTWMVGLAASFGPAVTILVAVALLGERLRPVQWLGLAGIVLGLVLIAVP
jgi:drug/metabolite transporter (DMT)-like permease